MVGPAEARPRLGRGLAALLGDAGEETAAVERARGARRVPPAHLRPNPKNPRLRFDEAELDDLAASVREKGVIQPILVRGVPGALDAFEIIAGERRWRAAQRAGLADVPITLVEASDKEALELAIVENVQREDLNAMEEAAGYERLQDEFGYTQNDLARVIGKSRSHVANTTRLLKLPDPVKKSVAEGALSAGHARALLAVEDPERTAEVILSRGLNVREAEEIARAEAERAGRPPKERAAKDPDLKALERALSSDLGLVVRIAAKGEGGELRLRYESQDQLDDLCRRLRG